MSTIWPSRGCVYKASGQGSRGLYKVEGLQTSQNENPILLNAVNLEDSDVIGPVTTINAKFKVLYVFGEAFGNASIQGEMLLGKVDASEDRIQELVNWFWNARVSKLEGPVSLSIKNEGYSLYVYGLVIGDADPDLNIQRFAINGLITQD